jgi:hypothetical protein
MLKTPAELPESGKSRAYEVRGAQKKPPDSWAAS